MIPLPQTDEIVRQNPARIASSFVWAGRPLHGDVFASRERGAAEAQYSSIHDPADNPREALPRLDRASHPRIPAKVKAHAQAGDTD